MRIERAEYGGHTQSDDGEVRKETVGKSGTYVHSLLTYKNCTLRIHGTMALWSLPLHTPLVQECAKWLKGEDLARLQATSRTLREACGEEWVWEAVLTKAFGRGKAERLRRARGDASAMAAIRDGIEDLPRGFLEQVDRVVREGDMLLEGKGEGPEGMMDAVYKMGCELERNTLLRRRKEWAGVIDHLGREGLREALWRFAESLYIMATTYDTGGGGFSEWHEVPWRRSALEFAAEMLESRHATERAREIRGWVAPVDEAIESAFHEAISLAQPYPRELPAHHRWFFNPRLRFASPPPLPEPSC